MQHYGVDKRAAKQLYLRMLYGGSIRAWRRDEAVPSSVGDLAFPFHYQAACRAACQQVLATHSWGRSTVEQFYPNRRTPEWTALSIIIGWYEDQALTILCDAALAQGIRASTPMFDGVLLERPPETESRKIGLILSNAAAQVFAHFHIRLQFEVKSWPTEQAQEGMKLGPARPLPPEVEYWMYWSPPLRELQVSVNNAVLQVAPVFPRSAEDRAAAWTRASREVLQMDIKTVGTEVEKQRVLQACLDAGRIDVLRALAALALTAELQNRWQTIEAGDANAIGHPAIFPCRERLEFYACFSPSRNSCRSPLGGAAKVT